MPNHAPAIGQGVTFTNGTGGHLFNVSATATDTDDGSGIRHRSHLDQLYEEAPNVEDYGSETTTVREQDLYAVPAHIHY